MRSLQVLSCSTVLLAGLLPACFDWGAYEPGQAPGAGGGDGAGGQGLEGGSGGTGGGTGGGSGVCTGDAFECLPDGSGRECVGGNWQELGECPLGCDEGARECRVPSNVAGAEVGAGDGDVAVEGGGGLSFNTDTGEIRSGGDVFRSAGEGLDAASGIAFTATDQGGSDPALGVFSMASLDVADGAVVAAIGDNAFVLVVDGDATIDGMITVAATDLLAGPGGFHGGDAGDPGLGPCAGQPGTGTYPSDNCASGSGGAGYGASGGPGGACSCSAPDNHGPGAGGPATCGTPELIPLLGGSGGAGGPATAGNGASAPGPGGHGGGALQITAAGTITVGASGRINAAGFGGAGCNEAGGAGGGAGGALLLEAPIVTVSVGAVLAANGGGGGAGDCN